MLSLTIRFYGELNDFLKPGQRQLPIELDLIDRRTVMDLVESLGPPHCEVGTILVNSEESGNEYIVTTGDYISVYPELSLEDKNIRQDKEVKFIVDANLGRLTRYLRMIGYDSLFDSKYSDEEIVEIANSDERIILTRDTGLLKRSAVKYGRWIRNTEPFGQIKEVVNRYGLERKDDALTFCLECNGRIEAVQKDLVIAELEPETREHFNEFFQCPDCLRVYWKGSHYEKMLKKIDEIFR